METVKQNYAACPKCGGEQVFNPRTGKVFCKNKCWLREKGSTELPKQENVVIIEPYEANKYKDKSFKVAYAKDLAIAMIHECALLKVDFRELEVMKAITDNSILIVGAMWARL